MLANVNFKFLKAGEIMKKDFWNKCCVIYYILDRITGKGYVGQTRNKLKMRILHHIKYNNSYLGNAIRLHGWENFSVFVLEECATPEELNEREIYWIKTLHTKAPYGYNLTDGGGLNGTKRSEETRKKMSESNPRKCAVICTTTGEIFPSMKAAAERFGITHGGVRGVCRGYYSNFHGLKFDYVNEEKRAAAEIERQKRSPAKQPIICIETGKIYESAVAASKATGIYRRSISFACAGKHATAGGLHWAFMDEEKRAAAEIELSKKTPNEKPVRCIETNTVYPSIQAASEATGINKGGIGNVCRKVSMTAGGYRWEFLLDVHNF